MAVTNGKGDLPLNFLIQRGSVLTLLGIVGNFVPTYVKLFPKFSYQKLSTSTDFDRVFRKISADVFFRPVKRRSKLHLQGNTARKTIAATRTSLI